ncbi:calcium-binding protein [Phaeobacter gallaeciensis]|uniref:calcium-binding protein n=1 Tax=Phaeobacter gallaeciensis TaxID=60890 RepID=UPI00237F9270|nr:calcium-binding protein [Phaeobacter gallaeciensis]MDE4096151.1 calcium-binding protein [Phaeobacter gallaeciensis]MDE4104962.1 calcium-binding protein [Phaeobacter gallaeciensis]MDE4109418.1 calcium-binding protein [Phaeobacter gallaeciensis]MDE4113886.1 calcium-binding protein [Phaeobacter gallaeciensis]MDE4118353.1 calcium-binding protein [Phaeobacter gallaeciensis]
MYQLTEDGDWTNDFDYTQTNVADIQPGHSVSGSVGGADAGDLIRVSLAYDQPYTFTLEGDGVSFEMLDDGTDAGATIDGNTMTYTAEHPSDYYNIRVSGSGSYTVTMQGLPADYLEDEDAGDMSSAPTLEIGSSITGVINGSGRTGETDYYAFHAIGGMDYGFSMAQADSPFGATSGGWLEILDADGEPVDGVSGGASAWDGSVKTFSPELSGTYYLAAWTYFGYSGAYTISSYTDAAPTNLASLGTISATESGGSTTVTLRVDIAEAPESDITGTVSVTAVDADYSKTVNSFDAAFTLEAGQTYVNVTVPVGSSADYSEDTIFVGDIAEIRGAGIDQGFLASESFVSELSNTPTAGDDVLVGTDGKDRILGLAGDDEISGLGRRDTLKGGAGRDTLDGDTGNDKLLGGTGRDKLFGGDGDDKLLGGGARDRLFGGSDADILDGQGGNDILTGGRGLDVFVFSGDFGNDKIRDFSATRNGEDIDLSGVESITGMRDLRNNHMSQEGDDVLIQDGNGNSITLLDVDMADLGVGDFIF